MQSSLGLVGDLDDVDLIEDIEAAFAVEFPDEALRGCTTVGDIFGLVEATLPKNKIGGSCATSMCFYRLRRALGSRLDIKLRPDTPISQLRVDSVRELYRIIEDDCRLRPPTKIISVWGCIALALIPTAPIAALTFAGSWWLAAISAVPPIALFAAAPIRLPADINTFGDLVRRVAARSIGLLSAKGARLREAEAWTAFKDIVADHTALAKDQILPDTLIFAPPSRSRKRA